MNPMDEMQTLEESRAFRRLGELLVLWQSHVSRDNVSISILMARSKRYMTSATQSRRSPWCCHASIERDREAWLGQPKKIFVQSWFCISVHMRPHLSGALIDTGNVDSRDELNGGRVIRVVGSAVNIDTVYAVLVDALIVILQVRHA